MSFLNKMEYEELVRKLEDCSIGTVMNITWDRGNGELSRDYVYFGKEDGQPILKRYDKSRKSLEEYSHRDANFDISNPALNITDVRVIPHKSVEPIDD